MCKFRVTYIHLVLVQAESRMVVQKVRWINYIKNIFFYQNVVDPVDIVVAMDDVAHCPSVFRLP